MRFDFSLRIGYQKEKPRPHVTRKEGMYSTYGLTPSFIFTVPTAAESYLVRVTV